MRTQFEGEEGKEKVKMPIEEPAIVKEMVKREIYEMLRSPEIWSMVKPIYPESVPFVRNSQVSFKVRATRGLEMWMNRMCHYMMADHQLKMKWQFI